MQAGKQQQNARGRAAPSLNSKQASSSTHKQAEAPTIKQAEPTTHVQLRHVAVGVAHGARDCANAWAHCAQATAAQQQQQQQQGQRQQASKHLSERAGRASLPPLPSLIPFPPPPPSLLPLASTHPPTPTHPLRHASPFSLLLTVRDRLHILHWSASLQHLRVPGSKQGGERVGPPALDGRHAPACAQRERVCPQRRRGGMHQRAHSVHSAHVLKIESAATCSVGSGDVLLGDSVALQRRGVVWRGSGGHGVGVGGEGGAEAAAGGRGG